MKDELAATVDFRSECVTRIGLIVVGVSGKDSLVEHFVGTRLNQSTRSGEAPAQERQRSSAPKRDDFCHAMIPRTLNENTQDFSSRQPSDLLRTIMSGVNVSREDGAGECRQ